jgi:hypothetical protein
MRLLLKILPELEHFPSRTEARTALKDAKSRVRRKPLLVRISLLIILAYIAAVLLLRVLGVADSWSSRLSIAVPLSAALATSLLPWLFIGAIRRSLRLRLFELGFPICVNCGYDLSHTQEHRCPECGFGCHLTNRFSGRAARRATEPKPLRNAASGGT